MSSQQQYCLKWNNHQTNLQRVFARLLRNEIFTDVTLACEGHALQAHKLVLSACSSYFEHLFTMHPDKAPLVILKDIKYDDIKAIVEFMYQGEINISQEQLPSLIRTAETLKVKGLAEVSTGGDSQQQQQRQQQQQQQSLAQQLQQQAAAAAGQTPVSGVPSAIPMAMVAATMADSPDLMKQVQRQQRALAPQPLPSMLPMMGSPMALQKTWGGQLMDQQRAAAAAAAAGAGADFNPVIANVAGNAGIEDTGNSRDIPDAYKNVPKLEEFMANSQPKENFWKSDTTKFVLADIRDRKIDLKTGAEILGVSYNTIYGRYREAHGLLSESPVAVSHSRSAVAAAAATTGSPGPDGTPAAPSKILSTEFGNVIQMNDFVNSGGSRPSFWDLDATKAILEAIRDKTIEMKHAAELLGVSYGTLYGRYRENYGYLKANWKQSSRRIGAGSLWEEPQTLDLLRRVNTGEVSVNEAAEKLGVDYYVLQYQLNLMDMAGGKLASSGGDDSNSGSGPPPPPSGMLTMTPPSAAAALAAAAKDAAANAGLSTPPTGLPPGMMPIAQLGKRAATAADDGAAEKRARVENGGSSNENSNSEPPGGGEADSQPAIKTEPHTAAAEPAAADDDQQPASDAAEQAEPAPEPPAAPAQPEPVPANGSSGAE